MPTTRRSRTIAAAPEQVWEVIADPHHLARWWPRVSRVEAVEEDSFTEVLLTRKGHAVRADFRMVDLERPWRMTWRQEIEGTPFARFLTAAAIDLELEPDPAGGSTLVTLQARESPHGMFTRFGTVMMRRAARRRLDEALDGLERILG